MILSKAAVKRPVTTLMLVFIIILLGVVSLAKLPIDLLPELEIPIGVVLTSYEGAGPAEIEKLLTIPLEEVIGTTDGIKSIQSISREGSSVIIAEFNYGTDMEFASLEMREKLDMVKNILPQDLENPRVIKIDPNALPVMYLALYGSKDLSDLSRFAENVVKPRLERLEGVASAGFSGGLEREIVIVTDEIKASGYGLTLDYISGILRKENISLPGGEIINGSREITLKTEGEFDSLADIQNLPIPLMNGQYIALKEIASVEMGFKENQSISRINNEKTVRVSIQKQSGTNTVKVAKDIKNELKKITEEYPERKISVVLDQSEYINLSIRNVAETAIIGGILAILILFVFFGNLRSTMILATSIPISVIATFILIYFNGITLNLMTFGGLALGVGMLVDNSIVVLENIYRLRQEGMSKKDAAIKGASEVSMAVTASTLTTIAVFLPIVFVEGITATIFRELALTVTMSLVASLIISLTLIPMLSSKILKMGVIKPKENEYEKNRLKKLYIKFENSFGVFTKKYKRLLKWMLNHRIAAVFSGLAVLLLSLIIAYIGVGAEYFPPADEGQLNISIALPEGSSLSETADIVTQLEGILEGIDEIEMVSSNIGQTGNVFVNIGTPNVASLDVILKKNDLRKRKTSTVAEEIRNKTGSIAGASIDIEEVSNTMRGFGGEAINITIKGEDLNTLERIAQDTVKIVSNIEGAREVELNIGERIPEINVKVNRDKSAYYGLTAAQIANTVKSAAAGLLSTRYNYNGDEIDVIIKGENINKAGISAFKQLSIQYAPGSSIPLDQLAEIEIDLSPSEINRKDQSRVVTVTGQIVGRDLASVSEDIEQRLSVYEMPGGYTYQMEGQKEELDSAFNDLLLALILAVILVYMILASQFESLLHPFTIMLTVPLAFSGGILAIFITGKTLSVPAFIGGIIMAGIVVNDAIVLIDYINTLRKRGIKRNRAVIKAGPVRLRPILITTITTVLGLLPMAIGTGEGAEILSPLAIVVIGGLTFSTLLTLIFIPVVYTLFDDLALKLKKT